MTDRHSSPNNRSRVDQSGYLPWQNMSGEEVPAFAVIQLKTNFDGTSKATKPEESSGLFYTSGPVPVPATKFGESLLWHKPQRVLIEGTATVGDEVGPVEDQWYMSTEGSGFRVLRQPSEGVGIVERVGGSGSGGTHWIEFTVVDVYCPGDYDYDPDIGKDRWYIDAEVNWYTGGCSKTPPGYDEYTGTVRIFDTCMLSFYTMDQLLGESPPYVSPMKGDAIYVYPFGGEECIPEWHVKAVCGVPSCGDSVSPPLPEEEE